MINEYSKYSYAILGAGRSGIGIAKYLNNRGIDVFVSESNPEDKIKKENIELLKEKNIEFEIGNHSDRIFNYDVIVKSPGIPMWNELILQLKNSGKKVIGELELSFIFCKCPVIAITGTNGKTTTVNLIGEMFLNAGFDAKVCGNVGLAFSEILDDINDNSIVILETSSYQLYDTELFKPKVAIFLNFTEDHLYWHKSMENYFDSKMKITANQDIQDLFIYNYDDEFIKNNLYKFQILAMKSAFTLSNGLDDEGLLSGCFLNSGFINYIDNSKNEVNKIIKKDQMFIKGMHNVSNAMAAIITAKRFNIDEKIIQDTLKSFKGVEHRIEFIREINGVKIYNDSKATNPDSTLVALKSFTGKIILIMGGLKMNINFELIKMEVTEKVKKIIAVGESKNDIYDYFEHLSHVELAHDLNEAVYLALNSSKQGDIILFSPSYKSFDMFTDFEHRGNEFKKIVNSIN
ncbi:MAG TPA: UDP-N-acetylmuramoyl-L-alanine--D-glutamate ligase [Ignavibacteria bacterium]|nr:UDP-N-acetylmuramoyl-L-alanine--D-glutamate ligase [Ignavibacteria bacterium]